MTSQERVKTISGWLEKQRTWSTKDLEAVLLGHINSAASEAHAAAVAETHSRYAAAFGAAVEHLGIGVGYDNTKLDEFAVSLVSKIEQEAHAAAVEQCAQNCEEAEVRCLTGHHKRDAERIRSLQPDPGWLEDRLREARRMEAEWWIDRLERENMHPTDLSDARKRLATLQPPEKRQGERRLRPDTLTLEVYDFANGKVIQNRRKATEDRRLNGDIHKTLTHTDLRVTPDRRGK